MTNLEKLIEKKKQLENQIASVKAREKVEEKKKDVRRKILIGAFFMNQYEGKYNELVELIDPFLTRNNDRELFGLPNSDEPKTTKKNKIGTGQ